MTKQAGPKQNPNAAFDTLHLQHILNLAYILIHSKIVKSQINASYKKQSI